MTPLDNSCSYFDVPTNFACSALSGELCNWPDGKGGRRADTQCHPERIEAAVAMNDGLGTVPASQDFDQAVDAALSGVDDPASQSGKKGNASVG